MKERPILFSSAMVRAIVDGRKTQTRRIASFIPLDGANLSFSGMSVGEYCTGVLASGAVLYARGAGGVWQQRTKPLRYFALSGDRLWVRETHHACPHCGSGFVAYRAGGWMRGASRDDQDALPLPPKCAAHGWRPSIHMPRWASRITLEVTGVRVERLQSITEDDAKAEGVDSRFIGEHDEDPREVGYPSNPDGHALQNFRELWDSINGERASWIENPWVWVVSFKRVEQEARAA